MQKDTTESLKDAIRVDAGQLRSHIDEAVRSNVEETLNSLLDAEADQICGASRYERSADRVDTRAGHYERQLETKAGAVTLEAGYKFPFTQCKIFLTLLAKGSESMGLTSAIFLMKSRTSAS
jgi:Transposase, Mutator family